MKKILRFRFLRVLVCMMALFVFAGSASAQQEKIIRSFPSKAEGDNPPSGVIMDAQGNLYGTSQFGGNTSCGPGCGLVFELSPVSGGGWTESVLYSFCAAKPCSDGENPMAGLALDSQGNLYGTTYDGGTMNTKCYIGCGVVFKLAPSGNGQWVESVIYAFTDGADGAHPKASPILDSAGNIYGTAGAGGSCCGVVFELTASSGGGWTESVIHAFTAGSDGSAPSAPLTFDSVGNLYGTAFYGGSYGKGVVFELAPITGGKWQETTLYSFGGANDGTYPSTALIFDPSGNLYGITTDGGNTSCKGNLGVGCGIVFELTPALGAWNETVLYSFCSTSGCADGHAPVGSLTFDSAGDLYGAAETGGQYANGVIFELTPTSSGGWSETVAHDFGAPHTRDGRYPRAGLILGPKSILYGTTSAGGTGGLGSVFELEP